MNWKYDLSTIRRAVNHDGRVEVDALEALRAIAEQLERVGHEIAVANELEIARQSTEIAADISALSIKRDDSDPT